jgi:hypothetical protein
MSSKIERIRASCSIEWAWKILGLPGTPGRTCKSPFREDKKPSFSVYVAKDGQRWFDQAEGVGGDVVDFWARAKGIGNQYAIDQLGALIGEATPPPAAKYKRAEIDWPDDLRPPTDLECVSLAMLRGLNPAVFDLAGRLGTLKIGTYRGELLWFLTDASKKGAEGKTFTGEPCVASGKKVAAISGSSKDWCYGLVTENTALNEVKNILFCEGTPDYFAALQLATESEINFLPVAMLGASTNIGDEASRKLKGRTVLILPHNDQEGEKSAKKWKERLRESGTVKRMIQRLPGGCKDLNEFMIQHPEDQSLLKGFNE